MRMISLIPSELFGQELLARLSLLAAPLVCTPPSVSTPLLTGNKQSLLEHKKAWKDGGLEARQAGLQLEPIDGRITGLNP